MANPELIQVLDYILNRCDESSIEVLAAAVVRRRRDLALFGGSLKMPDPQRMAKEISNQINGSISSGVKGLKASIRDMAIRIVRQEAPELSDEQIAELTRSWIPGDETPDGDGGAKMPRDLLASMIDQFVSFSRGTMSEADDKQLRSEMGAWPERYWKAFPAVVRSIVTDYLKDRISERDFSSKINIALEM
ncbi:MAG TPA: hypothetical protein DEQ14_12115 [Treponema sp.]|nr:hypothetical protein [Treponema sp.]